MAKDLKEYLAEHKCQGFASAPHYFPSGDFVTYYFRPDRCYAQQVDDLLTVYLAFDTNQLVGCKIKGVKHILDTARDFGIEVGDGAVHLGLIFFAGALKADNEVQKQWYRELGRKAKNIRLNRGEFTTAASV